jgi:hypothetical protein
MMNERIRELEEQCWEPTQYGPPWFNAEKFALLIVRECAEVCASIAAVRAGYNDADGRDTADSCCDQIKEHFGVE